MRGFHCLSLSAFCIVALLNSTALAADNTTTDRLKSTLQQARIAASGAQTETKISPATIAAEEMPLTEKPSLTEKSTGDEMMPAQKTASAADATMHDLLFDGEMPKNVSAEKAIAAPKTIQAKPIVKTMPNAAPKAMPEPASLPAPALPLPSLSRPNESLRSPQPVVTNTNIEMARITPQLPAVPNPVQAPIPAPVAMPTTIPLQKPVAQNIKPMASSVRHVPVATAPQAANATPSTPAAHLKMGWKVSTIASEKNTTNGFCLIEGSFDNDRNLLIGQGVDGFGTLGVNYGIDMLQQDRNYTITLQMDMNFAEDFQGQADSAQMAVAQLGRKPSFFQQLFISQSLKVSMPGVVSDFNISSLNQVQNEFENCLKSIGGTMAQNINTTNPQAINPRPESMPLVAEAPVKTEILDVVEPEAPMPKIAATVTPEPVMPAPIAKVAPEEIVTAEKSTLPEPIKQPITKTEPAKPIEQTAPLPPTSSPIAEKPKAEIIDEPLALTKKLAEPKKVAIDEDKWDQDVKKKLAATKIDYQNFSHQGRVVLWKSSNIDAVVTQAHDKDILDSADYALEKSDQSCVGQFESQLGLPETFKEIAIQPMESKCVDKDKVTVTAWLVVAKKGLNYVWQFNASRDNRLHAFSLRDKILSSYKD